MKRALTIAALLAAIPATAMASASTSTTHFAGTDPPQAVTDCQGNPYTFVIGPYTGVAHETDLSGNRSHFTLTAQGTETLTPNAPGLPSYTGHFAFWDGENINTKNGTDTQTFPNQLRGSDGSHIVNVNVAHISTSASGTMELSFSIAKCIQH